MKKSRRTGKLSAKQVFRVIIIVLLAALVIAAVISNLKNRVQTQQMQKNNGDIATASVTRGDISTWVYGSGSLSDEDVEKLELPLGVELETIHVRAGETVEEGQLLASVNVSSVMSAMEKLDVQMKSIDKEISAQKLAGDLSLISSSVSGRIKEIYIQKGDDIAAVMEERGALMLLSLDGYLATDIPAEGLSVGQRLRATDDMGGIYSAQVDRITGASATVLVPDDAQANGLNVTVSTMEGQILGSGVLSIHAPLKIVGTVGTVDHVYVRLNSPVSSGSSLFNIAGSGAAAKYESLLRQRGGLEEDYAILAKLYRQGGVHAPISGTIREIHATEVQDKNKSATTDSKTKGTASASMDSFSAMSAMGGMGMGDLGAMMGAVPASDAASVTAPSSASGSASGDDKEHFTISPDRTMIITVDVDESQILTLNKGQSATVTIDAIENKSYDGVVQEIDWVGSAANGITTYKAEIVIEKADGMLSGMSGSATIAIDEVEDALLLPMDALNRTGQSYFVYTTCNMETKELGGMVEVAVGITNANEAQILSGLSEGEMVYYEPKTMDLFSMMMNAMQASMPTE